MISWNVYDEGLLSLYLSKTRRWSQTPPIFLTESIDAELPSHSPTGPKKGASKIQNMRVYLEAKQYVSLRDSDSIDAHAYGVDERCNKIDMAHQETYVTCKRGYISGEGQQGDCTAGASGMETAGRTASQSACKVVLLVFGRAGNSGGQTSDTVLFQ